MSDEPLYCCVCGAEDFSCDHEPDDTGPYCQTCGVIPLDGEECCYYKPGGNRTGCIGHRSEL